MANEKNLMTFFFNKLNRDNRFNNSERNEIFDKFLDLTDSGSKNPFILLNLEEVYSKIVTEHEEQERTPPVSPDTPSVDKSNSNIKISYKKS